MRRALRGERQNWGIKMTERYKDDLAEAFTSLRAMTPPPSPGLLDRVLDDALREQSRPRPVAERPRTGGVWAALVAPFGGMPAVAGLCAAAILGVGVGYADPTAASYLRIGTADDGTESLDLMPTMNLFATEG